MCNFCHDWQSVKIACAARHESSHQTFSCKELWKLGMLVIARNVVERIMFFLQMCYAFPLCCMQYISLLVCVCVCVCVLYVK